MKRTRLPLLFACAVALVAGCGVKEETIKVVQPDVMNQVKSTLQNYAQGQPVTSEVTSYDFMVNEVRKSSPEKADILKAGLDDLKTASGATLKSKAKALMTKLGIEVSEK
ncbi:MAG: hypothetical protein ACKO9Z_04725 [Planctomycetota bacterium]